MTQEEKQLLLKDLCARFPYGVMLNVDNGKYREDMKIWSGLFNSDDLWDAKPYLRPISSLTSDECDRLFKILNINEKDGDWLKINDIGILRLFTENGKDFYEIAEAIDYLYSIHIDFRGMIEEGLAIKAPKDMYKTE